MIKKYLLAFLFPISLIAQDNFSVLDKSSMETSILYDRAFRVANIIDHSKKINAGYFLQAYSELSQADYGDNFTNIALLKQASAIGFRDGYIPIAILNTKFDILKSNVLDDGLVSVDSNNNLINDDNSVSIFETHLRTIVSPVSRKFKGLQCTFKILPELITNTTSNDIISIRANFNNGLGFQPVQINENIMVNYQSEGEKQIDFEVVFSDGSKTHNTASIVIQPSSNELNTRAPGDEGPITSINATIPYQGFGDAIPHIGTAEYKIYYDNVDGILDKPIFFVDGFDPNDSRTIPLMYDLLNYGNPVQNLAEVVRDLGFDLIVLNFPTYTSTSDNITEINGGADFIQRNAFIFVELMNIINGLKVGSEQNVVIGPSMGGLISRYALRYMEQNAMTHDARLYLSFDSPHLGANVPIGIQYLFNYMVNGDPGIVAAEPLVSGLLNSPAAKQMLVDHYLAHVDGTGVTQDPTKELPMGAPNFRTEFQNELNLMGFPQNTRNVTMINGSGIGAMTGSPGMSLINHTFDTGLVGGFPTQAIINTNFVPPNSSSITVTDFVGQVFFVIWSNVYSFSATAESPAFTDGSDSAPGGQFDLGGFDDGSDPLITEFVSNLTIDYFDFIPAVSGLALDVTGNGEIDWYHNIDIGPGVPPNGDVINSTPFVNWYMPDANEVHVTLTEDNVTFALTEILSETLTLSDNDQVSIRLERNPIQNDLNILSSTPLSNANIVLYDITGRQVIDIDLGNTSDYISIPLQLNSGLYIMKLSSDTGDFTTKLVVE